jgi:ABC-type multidrug transport system fused ATPase/permease subunit
MKGTVEENIKLARNGNDALLQQILDSVAISERLSALGGLQRSIETDSQLSGGEKQLIGILQMIYSGKKWIFLDEPFSAMDVTIRQLAFQMIEEYKKQTHATVIIISHLVPDMNIDEVINIR